jgi:hypothetical protein
VKEYKAAQKETEERLQEVSDRLEAAEQAQIHTQVAEDLEVCSTLVAHAALSASHVVFTSTEDFPV